MRLLSLREAAHLLGLGEHTARRVLADLAIIVGRRKRYPEEAIRRFSERGR